MIEFECHACGELLSTPDNSVGRKAVCPRCGEGTYVPEASTVPDTLLGDPFEDLNTNDRGRTEEAAPEGEQYDDWLMDADPERRPEPAADDDLDWSVDEEDDVAPPRARPVALRNANERSVSAGEFWSAMGSEQTRSSRPRSEQTRSEQPASLIRGGFWLRFVAVFLDGASLLTIIGIFRFVLVLAIAFIDINFLANGFEFLFVMGIVLGVTVTILYGATTEASRIQGTFGKTALDLAVVTTDGKPISFGRSLLRQIVKWLGALPLFVGWTICVFNAERRTLHDLVAGTRVVESK